VDGVRGLPTTTEVARSEGSISQYASGSEEGDSGLSRTLTLGLGVLTGA
jgi:hypothetical protein